jgi:hypothetical protein
MYSWFTRSCVFPLLALLPPVGVAFATNSLEFLVGITGSYAGTGIQVRKNKILAELHHVDTFFVGRHVFFH